MLNEVEAQVQVLRSYRLLLSYYSQQAENDLDLPPPPVSSKCALPWWKPVDYPFRGKLVGNQEGKQNKPVGESDELLTNLCLITSC